MQIIHWKAVEQYFTAVLLNFQFYPVCNFRKFINFGLGTSRSERVKLFDSGCDSRLPSDRLDGYSLKDSVLYN